MAVTTVRILHVYEMYLHADVNSNWPGAENTWKLWCGLQLYSIV